MKPSISKLFSKSKIAVATLVLFSFGLFVGFLFSFPALKIKQKIITAIETQGDVSIAQGDINIGFLSIYGSDLRIQPKKTLWPAISINSLKLSPQWLSLLSTNPGAQLDMQLFDGTLTADISRDGTLNLVASQLNLAFLSQKDQAMTLSGQLETMTLSSVVPLKRTSDSLLTLTLKNVNVSKEGDLKLALNLGDIVIEGTGRGRSFKMISLKTDRGDLSVTGKGSLLLGRDLSTTRVNMKMEIRPEATVDPMLLDLLKLGTRQAANGSYELSLSGSLSDL
jgi:type II secretion system protein N